MKNALSIAGVDPSGGAGVLADIKVFIAHGVYAMGAITAVTAQNTKGIFGMQLVEPKLIEDQIKAIFDDIRVDVIKIGVVPSVEIIKSVAKTLREIKNLPPVVLDPVMSCKNGDIWLEGAAKDAIVEELFPLASVITPNIFEAREILKRELKGENELKEACKAKGFDVKVVRGEGNELFSDSLAPEGQPGDTYIDMYKHNVKLITENLK